MGKKLSKAIRKGRDSHPAVISHGFRGAEALGIYRMRWGIETLFSHLKRRGYQFEDTHMTKGCRIGSAGRGVSQLDGARPVLWQQ